jgi:hypothetical protein
MFVGHYGVSFAAKRADPSIPLWGALSRRSVPGRPVGSVRPLGDREGPHRPGDHGDRSVGPDNSVKVGLGPWNARSLAFGLEAALFFGGMWRSLRQRPGRATGTVVFGVAMLAVQAHVFFGSPPASGQAIASTALIAYAAFAAVIRWLQDRRRGAGSVAMGHRG